MSKVYNPVATFPSSSNPTKTYTVSEDEQGDLSCTCPAWVFKKGGARTCKHVQEVERNGRLPSPSSPGPQPQIRPSFASAGGQGGTPSSERGGSLTTLLKRLEKAETKEEG